MHWLPKLWPTKKQWQSWSIPSKHTLVGLVIGVVGTSLTFIFGIPILMSWLFPCRIETGIYTDIVARFYARTNINNLKTVKNLEIPFTSQELFYEWKLTVLPNRDDIGPIVRLDHIQENDRISTVPADAIVSEILPQWASGFPETSRRKPDYYSYVIRFEMLAKDQEAVIKIRRPLKTLLISEENLIRVGEVRAGSCRITPFHYSSLKDVERLMYQAKALAELPIRPDPGDVTSEEVQATIEIICAMEDCTKRTIRQLEADMGKSPQQLMSESRSQGKEYR